MSAEEYLKLYRPVEEYEDDINVCLATKDGTFHFVTDIMQSYAREYHAKEMERKLGEAEKSFDDIIKIRKTLNTVEKRMAFRWGVKAMLNHLKEQKQDKG